jgi:hypothetical protein
MRTLRKPFVFVEYEQGVWSVEKYVYKIDESPASKIIRTNPVGMMTVGDVVDRPVLEEILNIKEDEVACLHIFRYSSLRVLRKRHFSQLL